MKKDEPYRQYVPGTGLSLERNTDTIPKDGWFYVMQNGEVIGRFKTLKHAQQEYVAIRETLIERSTLQESAERSTLDMDNYFLDKELYWSNSHNYRRGGGKGGRGGL